MAFTIGTATFTNGSTSVTSVSLSSGRLSYFGRGTRIVVGADPVLAEVEAISAPAVNEITLAQPWTYNSGTYAFLANMTSEGIRDAAQKVREATEALGAYEDGFNELLTSTDPTVTINGVEVVPWGYLKQQFEAESSGLLTEFETDLKRNRLLALAGIVL